MEGCPDCTKRSLWAYRTYRVHSFIVRMPKGGDAGRLFNFSIKNFLRFVAFKFVLGNISSLWYQSVLREGKRIHDYKQQTGNASEVTRETSSPSLP
jgi:hypothetical protein